MGASKNTYNLQGYFETAHFSARVAYTYRSAFYSGLDRNTAFSQDGIGTLSASLSYTINDNRLGGPRRREPQQPGPQVLCAESGPAAGVLPERGAVLSDLARPSFE